MIEAGRRRELSRILSALADELDVPPSKYADATKRYQSVGDWLSRDGSELAPYSPDVYPQGSFALGTAVRPLGDDDYDVDAVCLLDLTQAEVSQRQLKEMVGNRLKASNVYAGMLDPWGGGRRCWKLKYADESRFHLDILPAIPDGYSGHLVGGAPASLSRHAICITDTTTWPDGPWPGSNPKGYAEWFRDRMRAAFDERRRYLALEKRAEIQQIPEYEVRTPLQRTIQLLKRHRDLRYNGDEDKPTSIVLTTLAAHAYSNEADLVEALLSIVPGMRRAIGFRNGRIWIPNPANLEENFADRWTEAPRKAELFSEWLDALEREHLELLSAQGFARVGTYLTRAYGQRDAVAALEKYAGGGSSASPARAASPAAARERGLQPRSELEAEAKAMGAAAASGTAFVTSSGRVTRERPGNEEVVQAPATRFYGTSKHRLPRFRRPLHSPVRTYFQDMKRHFPGFRLRNLRGAVCTWTGTLRPIPGGSAHRVTIRVPQRGTPIVFVDDPPLLPNAPHRYGDGSLCLYFPPDRTWTRGRPLSELVALAAEWLWFYQVWLITETWFGPEADHTGPKGRTRGLRAGGRAAAE